MKNNNNLFIFIDESGNFDILKMTKPRYPLQEEPEGSCYGVGTFISIYYHKYNSKSNTLCV